MLTREVQRFSGTHRLSCFRPLAENSTKNATGATMADCFREGATVFGEELGKQKPRSCRARELARAVPRSPIALDIWF